MLCACLTMERVSPSLSPSSRLMLMDWPYSVVSSLRRRCRAHMRCPAAGEHRRARRHVKRGDGTRVAQWLETI